MIWGWTDGVSARDGIQFDVGAIYTVLRSFVAAAAYNRDLLVALRRRRVHGRCSQLSLSLFPSLCMLCWRQIYRDGVGRVNVCDHHSLVLVACFAASSLEMGDVCEDIFPADSTIGFRSSRNKSIHVIYKSWTMARVHQSLFWTKQNCN